MKHSIDILVCLFCFKFELGTITAKEYAKEREQLREMIGEAIGITANVINSSTNLVKDDLPLELLTV